MDDAIRFVDRREAGRLLSERLLPMGLSDPVVYALPRGGVPVAAEVAKALRAPLDVLLVRKIGAPNYPEYGVGAVIDGASPQILLDETACRTTGATQRYVKGQVDAELREIERRRQLFEKIGYSPVSPRGRTAIVVDDGAATGGTMAIALTALRQRDAYRIIAALPVAPRETVERLQRDADEVICLATPERFGSVGAFYDNFEQLTDEDVLSDLKQAWLSVSAG